MARVLSICKRSTFMNAIKPLLFHHGIELAFVCNKPKEALKHYKLEHPDIVLMNANWSESLYKLSGRDIMTSLSDFHPNVRIVLTTNIHDPDLINRLNVSVVKGYTPKIGDDILQELVTCIKSVHGGGQYYYHKV